MLRCRRRCHEEVAVPFVRANALDLYFELHGAGPPLLYIGGTGGDLRRTRPDRLPLNRSLNVLSYDQRGLGRSAKPAIDYTMADYADDAAALVSAHGWNTCHVVGTSFGGMVALNLAARHPELVDRLVLNCTSAGGVSASYPLQELSALDPDTRFETRMRLLDSRWDPAAAEPIPDLGAYYEVVATQSRTEPGAEQLDGLLRQLGARAGHDVVSELGSIALPTLVCAGRFDGVAPLANSQFLADRLPNAMLRTFDGGHLFLLQDPSAYHTITEYLLGDPVVSVLSSLPAPP
jgi:3-oxoadipate enol-lactonase